MDVEEERYTRSHRESGDEPLPKGKGKELIISRTLGASRRTSRICVVAAGFRNCSGSNHEVC